MLTNPKNEIVELYLNLKIGPYGGKASVSMKSKILHPYVEGVAIYQYMPDNSGASQY